jgi:basic membrane protein A
MKKIISLLLAAAMLLSLAACGSSGDNGAAAGESEYKIAMMSDFSGINDQSFNQTTWEACSAFGEANGMEIRYYQPTTSDDAGRIAVAEMAIADGYNVIVMPGYAFAATVVELANNYPDVKLIALDVSMGDLLEKAVTAKGETYDYNPANWDLNAYVNMTNVYCAVYQEELCGYMAGYAAVKLGYTSLGFLGGMAVPAVQRFGYGYVQGADAAAAELGIQIEMNYVYGGIFYGDADITAVMDTWYANGTQVVFACGGSIWSSAAESAKKYGGKIIGVDTDQAALIDAAYGEGLTITSAMKGLAPTTINTLTEIVVNGNWESFAGKVETLGLVSEDPAANYVQLAPSTLFGEGFTSDDYAALVKAMLDGTVVVSNDTTAMPATTNTNLSNQGSIK